MGCLHLNCLWEKGPWAVLISEARLLGGVLVGLGQNRAGDSCSNLSTCGIEFQGLGMLPGADIFFVFSWWVVSEIPLQHTNRGEAPSAPRVQCCGLLSHFIGNLWMNQTVKLFRESRNKLSPISSSSYLLWPLPTALSNDNKPHLLTSCPGGRFLLDAGSGSHAALPVSLLCCSIPWTTFWAGAKRLQPTSEARKVNFFLF